LAMQHKLQKCLHSAMLIQVQILLSATNAATCLTFFLVCMDSKTEKCSMQLVLQRHCETSFRKNCTDLKINYLVFCLFGLPVEMGTQVAQKPFSPLTVLLKNI
jgi:hypothetical protein